MNCGNKNCFHFNIFGICKRTSLPQKLKDMAPGRHVMDPEQSPVKMSIQRDRPYLMDRLDR